jgi:hypothetical protein
MLLFSSSMIGSSSSTTTTMIGGSTLDWYQQQRLHDNDNGSCSRFDRMSSPTPRLETPRALFLTYYHMRHDYCFGNVDESGVAISY